MDIHTRSYVCNLNVLKLGKIFRTTIEFFCKK